MVISKQLLDGVVGIATISLVSLFSIPGLKHGLAQTRLLAGYEPVAELYEDKDGYSTAESVKKYSIRRPRIAVWLVSLLGLGTAITLKVLTLTSEARPPATEAPFLSAIPPWSDLISWVGSLYSPDLFSD